MKRCKKCIMPETWEGISFDKQGICNICREDEKEKNINWDERQIRFKKILKYYKRLAKKKGNKYDCVIGYGGGKDSTYILWAMVKKYGMKPLVVTFDHGFPLSPEAKYNLMEIPKKLDCDHVVFTLGDKFRNTLCKKGTEVNGDFCFHCHNGVGTFPARISKQWDIPLQIWGEPTAKWKQCNAYDIEDFEEQDEEHFLKTYRMGVTPEMVKTDNYEMRDFMPLEWVEGDFSLKAIYLGHYELWDIREHVKIITKELGWKHCKVEGSYEDFEKIDCPYEPVRDWQKFTKRGFGRSCFLASKDIREGLITREQGLKLAKEYDGKKPKILKQFLKDVGMSEEEFNKLTRKHVVK